MPVWIPISLHAFSWSFLKQILTSQLTQSSYLFKKQQQKLQFRPHCLMVLFIFKCFLKVCCTPSSQNRNKTNISIDAIILTWYKPVIPFCYYFCSWLIFMQSLTFLRENNTLTLRKYWKIANWRMLVYLEGLRVALGKEEKCCPAQLLVACLEYCHKHAFQNCHYQ